MTYVHIFEFQFIPRPILFAVSLTDGEQPYSEMANSNSEAIYSSCLSELTSWV